MSREAMKLALEHAKRDERHLNHAETRYWCRMYRDIAEKAVEALAKPDFWEGYVPEPVKPAQPVAWAHKHINAALAAFGPDEAISMTQETWAKLREAMRAVAEQPAQQEPVACVQDLDEVKRKHLVYEKGMDWKDPLYTSPPTLSLAQRTWVRLTPEETLEEAHKEEQVSGFIHGASWASFKLRERNT